MTTAERFRLPNLVIVGVGKAGTTSLFWYLSQHPDICASDQKEIRYFSSIGEDETLPPLEGYAEHFARCGDQRYRLEASPQYFHGGERIIEAMQRVLGDPNVVLSLRDPVDRLWSTYRFVKSRMGPIPPEQTFDEYIDISLRLREKRAEHTPENRAHWTLNGGFYVEYLRPWLEAFGDDAMRVVFFEDLATRPAAVVQSLCMWLEIDPAPAVSISYSVENKTAQFRSRALQKVALAVNDERFLGSRRRLKAPLRRLYYSVNRKRESERMSEATRARLREIYAPANAELAVELTRRGYSNLPAWLVEPAPAGRSDAAAGA